MGAIPNGNIGVGSWFFSTGYAPLCANMASHWRTMERKKSQDGDPFGDYSGGNSGENRNS